MQILQEKWTNYVAYRQLSSLWAEFNSGPSLGEDHEEYEKRFADFLECYIRIAYDQIRRNRELETNGRHNEQKKSGGDEPGGASQSGSYASVNSPDGLHRQRETVSSGSDNFERNKDQLKIFEKVFSESKKVQEKIFEYLNHRAEEYNQFVKTHGSSGYMRPSMPLKKNQIELFQNCLEAMKMILKDHGDISEFDELDKLMDILISQFSTVTDAQSMKTLLILIQFIFQNGEKNDLTNIRVQFGRKLGFHEALKQFFHGDADYRRYIRAFFRQNLTYQTKKTALVKSGNDENQNRQGAAEDKNDEDTDEEILLEDEKKDKVFAKMQKFIQDKFQNIKQENIEDFFYSQDNQAYFMRNSFANEDLENNEDELENRERSASSAPKAQDNISDTDYESIYIDDASIQPDNDVLPSKHYLEKMMGTSENLSTRSFSTNRTNPNPSQNPLLHKAPPELQQVLNHKKQIDNLNKMLREKKIFEAFSKLIGQSTLDNLFEFITLLKFMVNQDQQNKAAAKEAQIYSAITNSFKRLVKYGQQQDIKQETVLKCFSALLKMSTSSKQKKITNVVTIKNFDALFCSLYCVKILLKSKTKNNYSDSVNNLCEIMKEGAAENCIRFYKQGGFLYVKEWIESLILDSSDQERQLNVSIQYISKILELCGIILYNLGDLDKLPFANEILDILIAHQFRYEIYSQSLQYHEDFHLSKRELLIDFVISQLDDKSLRLDLRRPNVSYIFDDVRALAQKALKIFESHRNVESNIQVFIQNLKLLLKLIKYQIDQNDRDIERTKESIFGNDFDTQTFISDILKINPSNEEYHAQMVFLASQILICQQFVNRKLASTIFVETLCNMDSCFTESFACLYLSQKYNKQSFRIKKYMIQQGTVEQRYYQFLKDLQNHEVDESLMNLHLLILLTQGSQKIKDNLENQIDFDDLISNLCQQEFNEDDQLFVLRCLLELSSEQTEIERSSQIYQNALDSCFIYMNHGCQDENSYNIFQSLFLKVHQNNSFMQRFGSQDVLKELKNRSRLFNKSKKYRKIDTFCVDEEIINPHAVLRKSQFLNAFMIFLFQSQPQVQIQLFNELEYLLFLNSKNKQVFVSLGLQDFFLQILLKLCTQYTIPQSKQNQMYVQGLVKILERLLEYSVELKESSTSIQEILLTVGQGKPQRGVRAVNVAYELMKSVIKVLGQTQLSKFTQFDELNRLECKFDENTQFLTLQLKIEGNLKFSETAKKLLTVKFDDKQQFSLVVDRGKKMVIKHNDQTILFESQLSNLGQHFEFDICSFNKFQFIIQSQQFIIILNDRVFCNLAISRGQPADPARRAASNKQVRLVTYQKMCIGNQNSFVVNKLNGTKRGVVSQMPMVFQSEGTCNEQSPDVGRLVIIENTGDAKADEKAAEGLMFREDEEQSKEDQMEEQQKAHLVVLPLRLLKPINSQYQLPKKLELMKQSSLLENFDSRGCKFSRTTSHMNIKKPSPSKRAPFKPEKSTSAGDNNMNGAAAQPHLYQAPSFDPARMQRTRSQMQTLGDGPSSLETRAGHSSVQRHNEHSVPNQASASPIRQNLLLKDQTIYQTQLNLAGEGHGSKIFSDLPALRLADTPAKLFAGASPQFTYSNMKIEIQINNTKKGAQRSLPANYHEIQSLKQFLSHPTRKAEETLKLLLQLLDQCQDSTSAQPTAQSSPGMDIDIPEESKFTLALSLLGNLMIENEQILETFSSMNGFQELLNIFEIKMANNANMNEQTFENLFNQLTCIVCNDFEAVYHIKQLQETPSNSNERSDPNSADHQTPNCLCSQLQRITNCDETILASKQIIEDNDRQLVVPQLQESSSRLGFLQLALRLTTTQQISNKNINMFLEQLTTLLSKSQSNMNVFRNNFGFKQALLQHVFQKMILSPSNRYRSIYETSLKLFEVFVEEIKNSPEEQEDKSKSAQALGELQAIFDFIMDQDFSLMERKNNSELETTVKVSIDILTIVFIHIIVSKPRSPRGSQLPSPQPRNLVTRNPLLAQLLKLDTFNLIMNLIQIDNLQIREHSIKILQLLIFVSEDFRNDFKEKQGYKLLAELTKESQQASSFNLCHTILNAILQTYDNPNDIRPVNNALVQQVMNKSKIASEIVSQTNIALNKPKKSLLVYYDMFDFFFQCVSLLDSDSSRCQIFKVLAQYLSDQQNDTNMAEAAEINCKNIMNHHFEPMLIHLFNYVKRQSYKVSDLLSQIGHQSGRSSSNDDEDAYFSGDDYDQNMMDEIMENNFFDQEFASHKKKNKSIEFAIDLMVKIVIYDLRRAPDKTKTFTFLRDFESSSSFSGNSHDISSSHEEESNFLQFLIITQLLNYFSKNSKVQEEYGDGSILINLDKILANLDQLIPFNSMIILKSLKLINSMAFKNSMEVRRQMKNLKMFELRDQMIIRHLKNVSKVLLEVPGESEQEIDRQFLRSVCDFSYDVLASKSKFRESKGVEILAATLVHAIHNPEFGLNALESSGMQIQDVRSLQESEKFRYDLLRIVSRDILQYKENKQVMSRELPELYSILQDAPSLSDAQLMASLSSYDPGAGAALIPEAVKAQLTKQLHDMREANQQLSITRQQDFRSRRAILNGEERQQDQE